MTIVLKDAALALEVLHHVGERRLHLWCLHLPDLDHSLNHEFFVSDLDITTSQRAEITQNVQNGKKTKALSSVLWFRDICEVPSLPASDLLLKNVSQLFCAERGDRQVSVFLTQHWNMFYFKTVMGHLAIIGCGNILSFFCYSYVARALALLTFQSRQKRQRLPLQDGEIKWPIDGVLCINFITII